MSRADHQLVVFGDSLSDAGTFGFRFTTNPGRTWAQLVADEMGCAAEPYALCNFADAFLGKTRPVSADGGLNFAQGGARVAQPYSAVSDERWGIPWSATRQVDAFLAAHERFGPEQLVVLFIGTNDVTYRYDPLIDPVVAANLRADVPPTPEFMAGEIHRVELVAEDCARLARRIRGRGARRILVMGTYDLAAAPWFGTPAARFYVGTLARAFNKRLEQTITDTAVSGTRYVDIAAFIDKLVTEPARYGFVHGFGADACAVAGSDFCTGSTQRTETAHRDHVFAASVHFSTATNELLAQHVIEQLGDWLVAR